MTLKELNRCYQYRWGTFAESPNVARICRVIWKDLLWRADSQRLLCSPLVQLSVFCENCDAARHWCRVWKQLLYSNNRIGVRWALLGLLQDEAWTDFDKTLDVNRLKRDPSIDITFIPPLFSLVNTFNADLKSRRSHTKFIQHKAVYREGPLPCSQNLIRM